MLKFLWRSTGLAVLIMVSIFMPADSAVAEIARPSDLSLKTPSQLVPPDCALFFSAVGWGKAKWDGGRDSELWVEEIREDCSATVVYAWGAEGKHSSGYTRVQNATIEDGTLTVPLNFPQWKLWAVATFKFEDSKYETLSAVWQNTKKKSDRFTATFQRGVYDPPQLVLK
jgi:hypothetical protein